MNEYAKMLWISKHGSRKDCGVNGKWYQYLIAISINTIVVTMFVILFCIPVFGWIVIYIVSGRFDLEMPTYNYYHKKKVYLTKQDAINAMFKGFIDRNPNFKAITIKRYYIPLSFPDSQWFDIAQNNQTYHNLRSDLSMTDNEIENMYKWIRDNTDRDMKKDRSIYCVHKHKAGLQDGLYVTFTTVDDKLFQNEYGKKIKEKYRIYPSSLYHDGEYNKDDFRRLYSQHSCVNYGCSDLIFTLNWGGNVLGGLANG